MLNSIICFSFVDFFKCLVVSCIDFVNIYIENIIFFCFYRIIRLKNYWKFCFGIFNFNGKNSKIYVLIFFKRYGFNYNSKMI